MKQKYFNATGEVLILVLMEWRWNKILRYENFIKYRVLILVLMEWRWNTKYYFRCLLCLLS